MTSWAPADEPMDRESFLALYRGALSLASRVQRLRAATLLLLVGRLGLSIDEAIHCHAGWIDWDAGVIEIPEKDPCACESCWSVARDRRTHSDPIAEVCYEECWSPPPERRARTVPFGWSPRCYGALASAYDRWAVIDGSPDEARNRITAAARKADDVTSPSPSRLTATAAATFRELGLGVDQTASVIGVEPHAVRGLASDRSGVETALARLAGRDESAETFPLVCGTEQLPGEPFAPTTTEPPESAVGSGDHVGVPRDPDPPNAVDYDPSEHEAAGPPLRRPSPGGDSATGDAQPIADGARSRGSDGQGTARKAQTGPEGAGTGPDANSPEPPSPDAPLGSERTGLDEALVAEDGADEEDTEPETPRDVLTAPVVADVTTRIVTDQFAGGHATDGRFLLGSDELLVLRTDGEAGYLLRPLAAVRDVRIDQVPTQLRGDFPHCVTLALQSADGDTQHLSIQLPPSQRRDLASVLYRLVLNATRVTLRDPDRIAGRVTDADAVETVVSVRPDRVEFTDPDDRSTVCSFDLGDVIHVERAERDFGGQTRPAISLRRVTENRPVTTTVATPGDRDRRLLHRYLRRTYRETLETVRALRLSDPEKMILVALYSSPGTPDLGSLLDVDDQQLEGALQSLTAKELIRRPTAETELTGMGQLVVSDRLDSVNR